MIIVCIFKHAFQNCDMFGRAGYIYTYIYIIKCIEIEMYTDTMKRYKTLDADPSRNRSEFDDS